MDSIDDSRLLLTFGDQSVELFLRIESFRINGAFEVSGGVVILFCLFTVIFDDTICSTWFSLTSSGLSTVLCKSTVIFRTFFSLVPPTKLFYTLSSSYSPIESRSLSEVFFYCFALIVLLCKCLLCSLYRKGNIVTFSPCCLDVVVWHTHVCC